MRHGDGTVTAGRVHGLHLGIRLQPGSIACGIAGIHVFNIRQSVVREGQRRGGNRVNVCPVMAVTSAVCKCVNVCHRAGAVRHRRRVTALQNAVYRGAAGVHDCRKCRGDNLCGAGHRCAARVRRDGEVRHIQRDRLRHRCRHAAGVRHCVCSGEVPCT